MAKPPYSKQGTCRYCGQLRNLDTSDWSDPRLMSERMLKRAKEAGTEPADHLASALCDCDAGKRYRHRIENLNTILDNISDLMPPNAGNEAFEAVRAAAEAVSALKCEKASFKFKGVSTTINISISRGKDGVRCSRKDTTEEIRES